MSSHVLMIVQDELREHICESATVCVTRAQTESRSLVAIARRVASHTFPLRQVLPRLREHPYGLIWAYVIFPSSFIVSHCDFEGFLQFASCNVPDSRSETVVSDTIFWCKVLFHPLYAVEVPTSNKNHSITWKYIQDMYQVIFIS